MGTDKVIQVGNIVEGGDYDNPQRGRVYSTEGISPCMNGAGGGGNLEPKILLDMEKPKVKQVGNMYGEESSSLRGRIFDSEGISPSILSHEQGGGCEPKIVEPLRVKQATKQGYIECPVGGVFDASYPTSELRRGRVQENGEVSPALTTNSEGAVLRYEGMELQEPQVIGSMQKNAYKGSVKGVAPCINAAAGMGGGHVPMLQEPSFLRAACGFGKSAEQDIPSAVTSSAYAANNFVKEAASELKEIASESRSCEVDVTINSDNSLRPFNAETKAKDGISEYVTQHEDNSANTVTSAHGGNVYGNATRYRIRKLTEREVFRLMDVSEEDIDKIQAAGISKTAQYRLAGNSIVVNVLYELFRKMFVQTECETQQLTLF